MIEGWKRSNDGTMVLQHTPLKSHEDSAEVEESRIGF